MAVLVSRGRYVVLGCLDFEGEAAWCPRVSYMRLATLTPDAAVIAATTQIAVVSRRGEPQEGRPERRLRR